MFKNILNSFSGINASLSSIEKQYTDKKETIYKALYEYICKQNDIEIDRTRALEAKANSFFPVGSLIATVYTSIFLIFIKEKIRIDFVVQYGLFIFGLYFFIRASYFWWKAIHVKGFKAPNTTDIKKTIVDNCDTPEEVYNHLYNTIESVVNQRKGVNKEFGTLVNNLLKNITYSVVLLIITVASTPLSFYLNEPNTSLINHNSNYEVNIMLNYSEPEDLPIDEEDMMMEDAKDIRTANSNHK